MNRSTTDSGKGSSGHERQYQTLGPKFSSCNRMVITRSKNCPFWDLKTDFESSRRDLASCSIRIALGAQKRHFFWKLICDLGFAGPVLCCLPSKPRCTTLPLVGFTFFSLRPPPTEWQNMYKNKGNMNLRGGLKAKKSKVGERGCNGRRA